MPFIHIDGDTPALLDEAKWLAFDVLAPTYPGYDWSVRAYRGGFFIRELNFPANYGMNCPDQRKLYSASAYKKLVIMMAGEWLERAHLLRRGGEGIDEAYRVEGVPEKYQPIKLKEEPCPSTG